MKLWSGRYNGYPGYNQDRYRYHPACADAFPASPSREQESCPDARLHPAVVLQLTGSRPAVDNLMALGCLVLCWLTNTIKLSSTVREHIICRTISVFSRAHAL